MKHKTPHYEVRFHLGRGENYLHWQVNLMQGRERIDQTYYDPADCKIEMIGCKLVNKLNRAKKVHEAGVKDVAGWVECRDVIINNDIEVDNLEKLYYNPIKDIHWRRESDDNEFAWDDSEYATLVTQGRQVYLLEERS
jgi:hypothetical protein